MFDSTPFEKIDQFCIANKIEKIYQKVLSAKFVEEYNDLKKQPNGQLLTQEQEDTLIGALLSKSSLTKNYDIAKSEIDGIVRERTKFIELKHKTKNAVGSVAINIVSSILYTLILIGFFALAEKEIRPMVQSFFQGTSVSAQTDKKPNI